MAIVIPVSCGGGGSDDSPLPEPTPTPTPQPLPDISGLESLKTINLQVNTEADLLSGITLNNSAELTKTQIIFEGVTSVIDDPKHYTPAYPGLCSIIFTVKDKDGKFTDYQAENLTIKPLAYMAMAVNNIQPVEILPII